MSQRIADRLQAPGRKRMLALDGGGTRGMVSIAFLQQIQDTLQAKLGRGDDFVLSDYFDLIGGTSVGSIIATLLALGWRTEQIEWTFKSWSPGIFEEQFRLDLRKPRFVASGLVAKIRSVVGTETLESEKLKTGLCIVTKRADTGSPWIMVNNPAARYWNRRGPRIGNKDFTLLELIRASTAAPSYFSPADITLSHDTRRNRGQTTSGR
ncbi:MAG: patatin-like phospholipase family protein, partial [Proteobacteria bacterium]|nr:patatin-like phospholipase family protein [Pseudomonadota bacterium]